MDLRQIYGDLAKQISEQNCYDYDDFDSAVVCLFSKLVQVERSIVADDQRVVHRSLADLTAVVLDILEYWTKSDWCLRSPKFERGKFESGANLTSLLRSTLADMVSFHDRDQHISRDVIITAELLLKRCIELSKKLDFDLSMSLFDHLRK